MEDGPIRRIRSALSHDERGEGVISMAIAMLIVAFLGVAAWVIFSNVLDAAGDRVQEQVEQVGS